MGPQGFELEPSGGMNSKGKGLEVLSCSLQADGGVF